MHKPSRILTSFFDDNLSNATFAFSPFNQYHSKILNGIPQLSDYATLKDMTSNQRKQGLFSLHESYLVYCESENKRSSAQVLDLTNSRLKPLTPEINPVKHGFVLTKNGTTYQLCFAQRETVDFWIDSLRSICIFSNFHEAYEGVKLLGEGSSGKVFLTESKQDKKLYAVKAFLKQSLTSPSQSDSKALLNEIKILRSLNHPLIVKLHEVYETDRTIYLITEYQSESKTLQEILSTPKLRNSLSEEDNKKIIYSIFEALSYLASKRIMHRDLKPANILVQAGGNIKLIDFGMAVEVDSDDYIYNRCGTPGYVAPEVFQYDPRDPHTDYDYACDMFSAGCILFYLIFGRPLFHKMDALGQNKVYTDHFIVAILVKEMKKIDCKLTQQGIDLLLKLLEANPKKRVTATECLKNSYFSSQIPSLIKILTLGSKERIEINYPLSSNGDTNSFISLDNTKDSMTSMDDPSDCDEYSDASFAVLFLKK